MTAPFGFGNFVGGSGPQGRASAIPSENWLDYWRSQIEEGTEQLGGLGSGIRGGLSGLGHGEMQRRELMAGREMASDPEATFGRGRAGYPGIALSDQKLEQAREEYMEGGGSAGGAFMAEATAPTWIDAIPGLKGLVGGVKTLASVAPVVGKKLLLRQIDPHKYSGTAMPSMGGERYLKDIQVDVLPTAPEMPRKVFNVDELEGTTVTPIVGDRSARGGRVSSIDETPLENPVYRAGGPDFMVGEASQSADEAIWASAQPIISRIQNSADRIADTTGDEVLGVYTAMSPQGVDFATFTSKAVAEQMPFSNVTKKAMADVDRAMKKVDPGWPGVGSPQLPGYLESGAEANTRVYFLQLLDMAPQKAAGFPDVGKARWAVTEPALREAKTGSAGFAIGGLIPGRAVITNPLHPHPTYMGAQLAGRYRGGLETPVPWQIMFPDAAARYAPLKTKKGRPLNEAQKFYKFGKDLPSQRMGPKEVDSIGEWIRRTSGSPR